MADNPELHISKSLKDLLQSLTKEERAQLKANIEGDGRVTDPILYWWDGKRNVIVDGMHRFGIVRGTDIPYATEQIEIGDTYEEVKIWMLDRQLGQRNLLSPQTIRKTRGDLYNLLKRKDGGHGDQIAGCQNDTPVQTAAAKVSGKAGVSEATVKRDGARVEALSKCSDSVQKGVNSDKLKLSDADIKILSQLNPVNQDNIARDMRGGTKTVAEAMENHKIKMPGQKKPKPAAKKKATNPPKKLDKAAYYKQWEQAIGPLMRTLDKIANGVDEKDGAKHKAILRQLDVATELMAEWMGVKP